MSIFSSFLGKSTPGLPQLGCATPRQQRPSNDQVGEWLYIVVDPKGIAPRTQPSYDKDSKEAKTKLPEGQLVRIVEKRPLAHSETCFLRLAEGGWCCDIQPGGDARVRMVEVTLEDVDSVYEVVAAKGVGIRSRPSFLQASITRRGPEKGELVETCQRLVFGETSFLRLADGSGWVFDRKNGKQILQGPLQDTNRATEAHVENYTYAEKNAVPDSEAAKLVTLWKLGFGDAALNQDALKACGGNVEAATEWLIAKAVGTEKENRSEDAQAMTKVSNEKTKFSPPSRVSDVPTPGRGASSKKQEPGALSLSTVENTNKDLPSDGSTLPSSPSTEFGKSHLDGYRNHLRKGDSPSGTPTGGDKPQESFGADPKMSGGSDSEDDEEDGVPDEGPANQATPQRLSRRDQYTDGGRKRDPSRKRSKSATRRKSREEPKELKDEADDDGDLDDDCGDVDEGTGGDGGALRVSTVRAGVDGTQGVSGDVDATTGKASKRIRGRTPRQRKKTSEGESTEEIRQTSESAKKMATPRGSKGGGKGAVPKRRASSRKRTNTSTESNEVQDLSNKSDEIQE